MPIGDHYPQSDQTYAVTPQPMEIRFTRLHAYARPPCRAHATDAGFDLYALPEERTYDTPFTTHRALHPGERRLFRTGIAAAIPPGFYGRIADRSGNALKHGLHVLGGVVDSQFRGDIGVILFNAGAEAVWIERDQRIAQLIIERCYDATFVEVNDLDATERASGGFGSTGT